MEDNLFHSLMIKILCYEQVDIMVKLYIKFYLFM